MRTKYTIINALVNVGGQILNQILLFIGRMVFIRYLSASYLGVNGLFTDVLGILNLAELGIGTAMIYSLYEPAAKDDKHKLAQLMNLYKWLYRAVSVCVFIAGLVLLPFLGFFIKGGSGIEHLRLIYMMYVANSACSYLLSYKNSIYLAYQKAYVKNLWVQLFDAIRTLVQIGIIVLTQNFILYLLAQFILQFIPNIIVSYQVDREFPYLKECHELPEKEERKGILKNIGAMSMHKFATVVVKNTDSLLMSSFVGLTAVGLYSNYKLFLQGINNLVGKLASAFTGSIGNVGAIEDSDTVFSIYREMQLLFYFVYSYWTVGLFALFNALITLCFGAEYCFSMATVGVFMTEFYIGGQRQVNLMFREAKGLFWYDRYKAIVEAFVNLVVSLILVQKFGVAGILGGTVVSSLTVCAWVEPYVLMRYGIKKDWKKRLEWYFEEYVKRAILVVIVSAMAYSWVHFVPAKNIFLFIVDGLVFTALYAMVMYRAFRDQPEFISLKNRAMNLIKGKRKNG